TETIVKIPTPEKPQAPTLPAKPEADQPDFSVGGEIFPPTRAPEPPAPEEADISEDDSLAPPGSPPDSAQASSPASQTRLGSRQALDIYLKAWIAGDSDTMYSLLAEDSQAKLSKELFAKDVMSDGFRKSLREGYKVDWSGQTAKVTVAKRILFMKTLDSKQIKFVEEGESARVSW
ncbi:MAG: hypothetical protein LBS93_08425, partial [Synergistaceae bacterium]|nr:hypothetical protein [Synergistaceae bacterium]